VANTGQIAATILPADATNTSVTWESSDEGVAAVDSQGLVTRVGEGSCTITCATADGEFDAACAVTVTAAPNHLGAAYLGMGYLAGLNAQEEES
jgi:uncharacterized protein YjdB